MAITLQGADQGDTSTIKETLEQAQEMARMIDGLGVEEVVADKGYHSGEVLKDLHREEVRSYIPEPDRGPRKWDGGGKAEEQKRVYANRRRTRGERSKRLQKLRSELAERSFAHMYETGGMRRVYLRGRDNILKRLFIQGAGFNLSISIRNAIGVGKPRAMQGRTPNAMLISGFMPGLLCGIWRSWERIQRIASNTSLQSTFCDHRWDTLLSRAA